MKFHQHMYDGSLRPHWAGPVSVASSHRNMPQGKRLHSVEMSGIVVPSDVSRRYLPGGSGHNHTYAMGLGFPDLRELFQPILEDSELSKGWEGMERSIKEAAQSVMGFGSRLPRGALARAAVPPNALHLKIAGQLIRDRFTGDKPNNAQPDTLTGELTKVFPIKDVSGTHMRMQPVGSPASFNLTPNSGNWSRSPITL
jgi:hypothetical protein